MEILPFVVELNFILASKVGKPWRPGAADCAETWVAGSGSDLDMLVPIRLSRTEPKILSDAPWFFNSISEAGLVPKLVLDIWISRSIMLSGIPAFTIRATSALVSALSVGACAKSGRVSERANRKLSWSRRVPRMCGASLARNLGDWQLKAGERYYCSDLTAYLLNAQRVGTCNTNFESGLSPMR